MAKMIFPLILIWTLVAVILHLCGVGAFAEWPITAWPWHWSCLCIFWWDLVLDVLLIAAFVVMRVIIHRHRENVINSYAPEQRAFIRKMMED